MVKILLTGGAGYIGSHTYLALLDAGYDPVIIDNFCNSEPSVIADLAAICGRAVEYVRCDVRDRASLDQVFGAHDFAAVIHFAALKAVGKSVADPLSYFENNTGGLTTLLGAMQRAGVNRFVFSSSATVYGVPEALPVREDAPTGFTNPYGFTKLMGEQMLAQLAHAHPDWAIGILRYFNPAGAHSSGRIGDMLPGQGKKPENLVPFVALVAAGEVSAVTVFGDTYDTPDGTGVRDYIHIEDLAEGHVLSLNHLLKTGQGHTVNLGTGQGYSVLEVIAAYSKACGRELPYEICPKRAGDIAAVWADVSRAEQLLGFRTKRGLTEMCQSSWHSITVGQ
jgi:UDP-glucose 4-epimerase